MTTLIGGILLPSSLFQAPWFITLGAFVAFNTVLFVGLSIGKILYWPQPMKAPTFLGHSARRPDG
jgi:hypothetical protein